MIRAALMVSCLFAFLIAAPVASAADAPKLPTIPQMFRLLQDDPEIPSDLAGVWDIHVETRNCGGPILNTIDESDTLCAGDSYDPEDDETGDVTCTGTASGGNVDITCSGTFEVFTGCTATTVIETVGTYSASNYSFTTTINITYTGEVFGCADLPDQCLVSTTTGTKTGPAPAECVTPVQRLTWSSLKTQFR